MTGSAEPCRHHSVSWQCWFLLLFLTWPGCRIFDKMYFVKVLCFPKWSETSPAITLYSSFFPEARGVGKHLRILFCPDLSKMLLLPADPRFSLEESHSAQWGATKSSPLPRSRLIYRLNFAAAFVLQLSEVSQHDLWVSVVLPFCWLVELLL